MRTIGLLGGMSRESSVEYERIITAEVRRRLGDAHSADLLMRSYDFVDIERLQLAGDWEGAGALLAGDARRLQDAGAELLLICANTMHLVAGEVRAAISIPLVDVIDTTAGAILAAGIECVALLGTRYTMELDFYRRGLERHGLSVLIPDEPDRTTVAQIIIDELVRGVIRDESRAAYLGVIERLLARGAQGVIAGCTEIELLVAPQDLSCPYFPTATLHAMAAVDAALR